jgi:hypothetical protein
MRIVEAKMILCAPGQPLRVALWACQRAGHVRNRLDEQLSLKGGESVMCALLMLFATHYTPKIINRMRNALCRA